jgi:hypothetical protein
LVGSGLTAEVFTWGEGRVVKLFFSWVLLFKIEKELRITKALQGLGVGVPPVFELIQIGERHGIVFERLRGHSMLRRVERQPWRLFEAARQLAELLLRVHACLAPPELPTQAEQINDWINRAEAFTETQKQAARQEVANLPTDRWLRHGDLLRSASPAMEPPSHDLARKSFGVACKLGSTSIADRACPP